MEGITSQAASIDYFQLLTVQLQSQDPIDSVDQEGSINDLTQFSILEGIEGLNASFGEFLKLGQLTQGVDLIGKTVDFQDPTTGLTGAGTAREIFTVGSEIKVLVDGQTVGLDQITRIAENDV